ncbi:MAG: hypothetical protein AUJ92_15260 [Armatimonadetes bacterium CG2_30_59_28]|nr:MAG: hypothetical protein AUJ92_15260 [Armatimonadetes bacterium CG2_30_59_28]
MNLTIKTRVHQEAVAVIEVAGELESANCDDLREEIAAQVSDARTLLIVDLREVSFIDSTGLGALVGGLKRTREKGGRLDIVCHQSRLLRILEISGLVRAFAIYETLEEALQAAEDSVPCSTEVEN